MATGQPGDFSQASYLTEGEKQLASDTFKTAVTPLKQQFDDQFNSKVNDLSQRGVLFGGLGNDLMSRTLKDQAEIEGNIAGQIGTSIGQTALERAFAANEAAKNREFTASESKATRTLSELLADKSIAGQQALQTSQQQFQSAENLATRSLQESLQTGQIQNQQYLQAQQLGFQGSQSDLDRVFQQSMQTGQISNQQYMQAQQLGFQGSQAELDRMFQEKRQQSEQQFQSTFQNAGFVQQNSLVDRQTQAQTNVQAMQLALAGNLGGNAVQELLDKTVGPGFIFKPEAQVALEQVAEASGLSVDEFNNVRRAMANGQTSDMLNDKRRFIPTKDSNGNSTATIGISTAEKESALNYAKTNFDSGMLSDSEYKTLVYQINNGSAGSVRDPLTGITHYTTNVNIKTGNIPNMGYGKPTKDANGESIINSDYIETPEKAKAFQEKLAKLYADTQVNLANISANAQVKSAQKSSSASVICTELYMQEKLPYEIYVADSKYGMMNIHPTVMAGYHRWAIPVASMMQRSPIVTAIVRPFATAWAYHMAYKMDAYHKENKLGELIEFIGIPICRFIGNRLEKQVVKNAIQ